MAPPSDRRDDADGYEQEGEDHRSSVPLDLDGDGDQETVIAQQAVGAENLAGGGEFPDRDRRPTPAARGYDPDQDPGEEDASRPSAG